MARRFFLALAFAALLASPAHADWFSNGVDIPKLLAPPSITIEDYELNKDDLEAFYAARNNRPAWDFDGREHNETLNAFLASLQKLIDYHGLQNEDYALALIRTLSMEENEESRGKLELLVSDTLLHLAHDLHGDGVDLSRLYPGWHFERKDMDVPATLAAAVAANAIHDYFDSLPPQQPAYTQLAQALQLYRDIESRGGWAAIDKGPTLRPGDHGPRIAQLRARLAAENYLPAAPLEPGDGFGNDLKLAVEAYQERNGLAVDGNVGPKVLEALNTPITFRIDQILANMERWRHMPETFPPERYTLVNIPDASIIIVEDSKIIYRGIVIVGRTDRKTPFIDSNVRSMIVNPSWHVPAKIARKDILPKLKQDPHYLEKLGFIIKDSEDDPYGDQIDWADMRERDFDFELRQAPGDMNSLGRLKFDFNNDFAVYMHGTPHQELFKKNERNLSSGCVRLHDPEQIAEIFLKGNKDPWDVKRIEDEINSNKTRWVNIANPMPLYFLYWTVFTNDGGQVSFRRDEYDYDRILMQEMKSGTPATPSP